jgi:hypothetical protein
VYDKASYRGWYSGDSSGDGPTVGIDCAAPVATLNIMKSPPSVSSISQGRDNKVRRESTRMSFPLGGGVGGIGNGEWRMRILIGSSNSPGKKMNKPDLLQHTSERLISVGHHWPVARDGMFCQGRPGYRELDGVTESEAIPGVEPLSLNCLEMCGILLVANPLSDNRYPAQKPAPYKSPPISNENLLF